MVECVYMHINQIEVTYLFNTNTRINMVRIIIDSIVISLKLLYVPSHHNYYVNTFLSFNIIINQLRKRSNWPTAVTN